MGKAVVGPVPVSRGGNICLYPEKPIAGSQWDVFDLVGESIASMNIGAGAQPCWNTTSVPPGIYIIRLKLSYSDGTAGTTWQKVLVTR
jgi:hypothetical protein